MSARKRGSVPHGAASRRGLRRRSGGARLILECDALSRRHWRPAMTSAEWRRPEREASPFAAFAATYAPADEVLAARLPADASRDSAATARIDARATPLTEAIRAP